jgi:hypothetical protein
VTLRPDIVKTPGFAFQCGQSYQNLMMAISQKDLLQEALTKKDGLACLSIFVPSPRKYGGVRICPSQAKNKVPHMHKDTSAVRLQKAGRSWAL